MAKEIAFTGNVMQMKKPVPPLYLSVIPLIYTVQACRIVTRPLTALEDPVQFEKRLKSGNYKANPKRLFKMIEANFDLDYLVKIITGWRLGLFLYPRVMRSLGRTLIWQYLHAVLK